MQLREFTQIRCKELQKTAGLPVIAGAAARVLPKVLPALGRFASGLIGGSATGGAATAGRVAGWAPLATSLVPHRPPRPKTPAPWGAENTITQMKAASVKPMS